MRESRRPACKSDATESKTASALHVVAPGKPAKVHVMGKAAKPAAPSVPHPLLRTRCPLPRQEGVAHEGGYRQSGPRQSRGQAGVKRFRQRG